MGFFSGYSQARVGGLLAGLGNLTARGSSSASAEAKRVVGSFVKGQPTHGSCSGSGEERRCGIVSTGHSLRTETHMFAIRGKADPTLVRVCIPQKAVFDEKGKETQESKDIRAVASALLSKLQTGVTVKTDSKGERRFVGRKNRARVMLPGECLTVRIPRAEGLEAELGTRAGDELSVELKRQPNKREFEARLKQLRARDAEMKAAIAAAKRQQKAFERLKEGVRRVT